MRKTSGVATVSGRSVSGTGPEVFLRAENDILAQLRKSADFEPEVVLSWFKRHEERRRGCHKGSRLRKDLH
jgi:hypothetical protein